MNENSLTVFYGVFPIRRNPIRWN